MHSDLEIRPYQPGDETDILELFRKSFGHDLGEEMWPWRFRDNPTGSGVIDLAWDGDILAGHYAVSSIDLWVDGRGHLTGLSGTTMTHPNYRGRGLFPKLARSTYAHMTQLGMVMVWGFPNIFSHRGFVRDLDWVDIYEIPTFRLSLAEQHSLPAPGHEIQELKEFDDRFDRLWELARDDYQVISKRDRRHLQWRYVQNPVEQYRILAYVDGEDVLGYAVLKRHENEFHVVDMLTIQDIDVSKQLMYGAMRVAAKNSASVLSLWLNVTHPLHRALERLGFRNEEPVTYFGGLVLEASFAEATVYDFHNWHLTMGDSDVY